MNNIRPAAPRSHVQRGGAAAWPWRVDESGVDCKDLPIKDVVVGVSWTGLGESESSSFACGESSPAAASSAPSPDAPLLETDDSVGDSTCGTPWTRRGLCRGNAHVVWTSLLVQLLVGEAADGL